MTLFPLYLKAAVIGLAVAAPVGPMSLLCMRRTLSQGWRAGLAIGAGIALGDAGFAALGALGLAGLSGFLLAWRKPLDLAAGLFLLWLGLRSFRRKPDVKAIQAPRVAPIAAFGSALALTLTNPPTIILFAAVFSALAPPGGLTLAAALATSAGVLTGSLGWWGLAVSGVVLGRRALGVGARTWIDRGSGLALGLFGLLELSRAL